MPSMNSKLLLQIWLEQVNLQIPVSILNVKPGLCQSLVSLLVLHESQFSIKSLKHSQGAPAKVCRMSFAQFLPQYLSRLLLLLRSVKSYPYTSSDDIKSPGKQMTFTQLVEFPFFHCPHHLRTVLSLQSICISTTSSSPTSSTSHSPLVQYLCPINAVYQEYSWSFRLQNYVSFRS